MVFVALSILSAVQCFETGETRSQIMYAVLFAVGMQGVVMVKIFAWQMFHRHNIKRDIKRLESRVVELSEAVKSR